MDEEKFYFGAERGNLEELKEILRRNPNFNINWNNDNGTTALHRAVAKDHDSIVSILLAHPDIAVNKRANSGSTAWMIACQRGSASCACLLLKDSRVNLVERGNNRRTPFWWSAYHGRLLIIMQWIASGREMDLGEPGDYYTEALCAAETNELWFQRDKIRRKRKVAALLQRFQDDPTETRHRVRVRIGWYNELAAEVFALVVFVSDGLLQIPQTGKDSTPASRFFRIASRLPLELQAVLCYRLTGLPEEIMPRKESELAFRDLVRKV